MSDFKCTYLILNIAIIKLKDLFLMHFLAHYKIKISNYQPLIHPLLCQAELLSFPSFHLTYHSL